MSEDQWKEQGDCEKCRRQKYCKKECKAHIRANYELWYGFTKREMDKRTGGFFSKLMETAHGGSSRG